MKEVITSELSGLTKQSQSEIKEAFSDYFSQLDEWSDKCKELVVTSEDQVDLMQDARQARLALVKVRTEADRKRKDLKADALQYGRAVQAVYNLIADKIKPMELHLKEQEKFLERIEEQKRKELHEKRYKEIEKYKGYFQEDHDFAQYPEDVWEGFVVALKQRYERAKELERKKEEEARREAEARDRKVKLLPWSHYIAGFKSIDFMELTDKAVDQIIKDAKAKKKAEEEKVRKQQEDLEQARKDREEERKKAEALAKKETERKRKEAEAQKIREAARKKAEAEAARAKRDAEEAKKKLLEEQRLKRQMELAKGDKQKMEALVAYLEDIPDISMKSKKWREIGEVVNRKIEECIENIKKGM